MASVTKKGFYVLSDLRKNKRSSCGGENAINRSTGKYLRGVESGLLSDAPSHGLPIFQQMDDQPSGRRSMWFVIA